MLYGADGGGAGVPPGGGPQPLAKVDSLDIMDERNFAAKYRGTSPNTSRTNAVKWYAVFTYGDKHVAVWFLGGKESKELYALKKQIDSTGQDITL